jgi:hypothetical protein
VTKERKERGYATGIITEVIRLQQIGQSPMYELRYAKASLGLKEWWREQCLFPPISSLNSLNEALIS